MKQSTTMNSGQRSCVFVLNGARLSDGNFQARSSAGGFKTRDRGGVRAPASFALQRTRLLHTCAARAHTLITTGWWKQCKGLHQECFPQQMIHATDVIPGPWKSSPTPSHCPSPHRRLNQGVPLKKGAQIQNRQMLG